MKYGWAIVLLAVSVATGCARLERKQIISEALPLSLKDIEEIRSGEESHRNLFKDLGYKLYPSPELTAYVTFVGTKLAKVSDRPYLPYQFFILDTDEVEIFGLGGGRVYITRGFFNFITSETELAGGLAHEIGHMANYQYAPDSGKKRSEKAYDYLVKATEWGDDFVGPYASGARKGLKAVNYVGPKLKKRFSGDEEQQADDDAIRYMIKAGYDPRGLTQLVHRLAEVEVEDVGYYVDYMKSHPPLPERRISLKKQTGKFKPQLTEIEMSLDVTRPETPVPTVAESQSPVPIADLSSPKGDAPSVESAAMVSKS